MLDLIEYIKQFGLSNLEKKYSIGINRAEQYPNLICLKYSHWASPFSEKLVRQARGIILDESNDWRIISYPYDKFFNYGEKYAATINWNNAKVYDKLDGSLLVLYYYDRQWLVQTSGTADARVKSKSDRLVSRIQNTYDLYRDIPSQKEFANSIKDSPFRKILFSLRNGKSQSIKEALRGIPKSNLKFFYNKFSS